MKISSNFKLGYKRSLIVTIISFSVITTLISTAVVYGVNQLRVREILVEKNNIMQEQLANTVDALFAEIDRVTIQYSLNKTVNDFVFRDIKTSEDHIKVSELLTETTNLKSVSPLIYSVDILYPHKNYVISNSIYSMDEMKSLKSSDVEYFEKLLISDKNYNVELRKKFIGSSQIYKTVISVSRYFERGTSGGITIIVNIDRDGFLSTVRQVCQETNTGYFILKDNNVLLANTAETEIFIKETYLSNQNFKHRIGNENVKFNIRGEFYYILTSTMKFGGLKYGLIIPVKDVTNRSNLLDYKTIGLFCIILVLCIAISWAISGVIYKPVDKLVRYINQSSGKNEKVNGKLIDDLGFIRSRFSTLIAKKDEVDKILLTSMPFIKRSFFVSLVNGRVKPEEVYEKLDIYGIKLYKKYFTALIVNIDYESSETELKIEEIVSLVEYKLEEELGKIKGTTYEYAVFELEDCKMCLLLNYEDKNSMDKNVLFRLCKRIQEVILHSYGIEVSLATGEAVDNIGSLRKSYMTARSLLEQAFVFGKGQIILSENYISDRAESIYYPLEEVNALVHAVKNCDKKAVDEIMDALKETMSTKLKQNNLQFMLPQLIFGVIHGIVETEGTGKQILDEASLFVQLKKELLIPRKPIYLEKYFSEVKELFYRLIEYKRSKIFEKNSKLVNKAVEYIDARFTENLSVEDIADYLCVSSGHLTKIFKFEKSVTVMEYLTEKKLQYAIELIEKTDTQIQDISKKAGYNCSRTFIRAFKNRYGITPGQAREKQQMVPDKRKDSENMNSQITI